VDIKSDEIEINGHVIKTKASANGEFLIYVDGNMILDQYTLEETKMMLEEDKLPEFETSANAMPRVMASIGYHQTSSAGWTND